MSVSEENEQNKSNNNDIGLRDPETKRVEFSKALFNTLGPAVKQCDEVVRGVFQSQNKVLTELSNLEQSYESFYR